MPRPVNTGRLQQAFAQLGQSNSVLANRELQQRELDRQERASTGALAGSLIGGAIGGPAGAQAGGFIGTKIAGGRTTPGQATSAGMAIGQAMQPTQEEQNQSALQEIQAARAQQQQQELDFNSAFQPVQTTPEGVAIAEGQPQPFQATQQDPQPVPFSAQPGFASTFQEVQPEAPPPPVATQSQVEFAKKRNESDRIKAEATMPRQVGGQKLDDVNRGALQNYINQQENQLGQERQILENANLSPQAFAIQQARVNQGEQRLGQIKEQAVFLNAQSEARRGGGKSTLFQVKDSEGKTIYPALTQEQLLSKDLKEGHRVFQVGKEGQQTKTGGGGIFKASEIREMPIDQLKDALVKEQLEGSGTRGEKQQRAKAIENQIEFVSEENFKGVRKEISKLNLRSSEDEFIKVRDKIDALEESGEIDETFAMKKRKELNNKLYKSELSKNRKLLPKSDFDDFNASFELQDSIKSVLKHEKHFKNIAFEVQGEKLIATVKQSFGGQENVIQEVQSAIEKLRLLQGNSMVKGALSDADMESVSRMMVNLNTAPESMRKILGGFYKNLQRRVALSEERLRGKKDLGPKLEERISNVLSYDPSLGVGGNQEIITPNPSNVGDIRVGQRVRLPNGRVIKVTESSLAKFKKINNLK